MRHSADTNCAAKRLATTAQQLVDTGNNGRSLSEGVTAFFTDCVLQDEGFGNFNDAYRDQKKKAEKLMKGLSGNQFDVTASFNFNYEFLKMANALGFTTKQFVALGTGGFTELAKRMKALL